MTSVNLPVIIRVDDYHEFYHLQEDYQLLIPGIKIREVGNDPEDGVYSGMVYVGNLKSPENRNLLRQEESRLKKIGDNFDWSQY